MKFVCKQSSSSSLSSTHNKKRAAGSRKSPINKKSSRIWLDPEAAPVALRGDIASCQLPWAKTGECKISNPSLADSCKKNVVSEICDSIVEVQTHHESLETNLETFNESAFVDEEELFNMPVLLDSMAEGMLLTPPAMKRGFNWSHHELEDCADLGLSLW